MLVLIAASHKWLEYKQQLEVVQVQEVHLATDITSITTVLKASKELEKLIGNEHKKLEVQMHDLQQTLAIANNKKTQATYDELGQQQKQLDSYTQTVQSYAHGLQEQLDDSSYLKGMYADRQKIYKKELNSATTSLKKQILTVQKFTQAPVTPLVEPDKRAPLFSLIA
ncbi:MAG: hypothetical protein H6765_10995 [Candidatus Peribacteria bacterium]|nr:MAG: hypothetical protein H6765_10995 [Candidatus Peribacteria bacterium]